VHVVLTSRRCTVRECSDFVCGLIAGGDQPADKITTRLPQARETSERDLL
jgi:hypothetical protein